MPESILTTTKKTLGLAEDYTAFDLDVITHINAAFFTLSQLGVGQSNGFQIIDDEQVWEDFMVPSTDLNAVRTYIYLRTRLLFDPPSTSFHLEALNKQITEMEWRLNLSREAELVGFPVNGVPDYIDGGSAEGWED